MKKISKRVLSVILSLVILSSFATTVMASGISPRNILVTTASCTIGDKGNNTAAVMATITALSTVTLINLTVEVQVKGFWGFSTDQTLSTTFYKNTGAYSNTINIDSSKTYRLFVTFDAYAPSSSETITKYSAST